MDMLDTTDESTPPSSKLGHVLVGSGGGSSGGGELEDMMDEEEDDETTATLLQDLDVKDSISTSTTLQGSCAICTRPAHGIHFSVLSCRACAAFYRRAVVLKRRYKCRRATGKCRVDADTKPMCRACRFDKCLRLGMVEDNVHFPSGSSDPLRAANNSSPKKLSTSPKSTKANAIDVAKLSPISSSSFSTASTSSPSSTMAATSSVPSTSKPSNIDRLSQLSTSTAQQQKDRLFVDATKMLDDKNTQFIGLPSVGTHLERMALALRSIRSTQTAQPEIVTNFDILEHDDCKRGELNSFADWLVLCPHFSALQEEDKMTIFKYVWMTFVVFERCERTVRIFGGLLESRRLMLIDERRAIDMENTQYDLRGYSDYNMDAVKRLFEPIVISSFRLLIQPLRSLRLTDIEIAFVLCNIAWNVDEIANQLSAPTLACAQWVRERVASDLHDYYVNHMHMTNYAARVAQLITLVHQSERLVGEELRVIEMFNIFDVIRIEYSDSDLFRGALMNRNSTLQPPQPPPSLPSSQLDDPGPRAD